MPAAIILKNVTKIFEDKPGEHFIAVSDVSLEIKHGEFFLLLGPSGCGKSTLLRIMCGLEKKFEGELEWKGGLTQNDFSFVFQQFALLPWLTVFENVELGLLNRAIPENRHHRVMKELKRLNLEKFSRAYPKDLSGGMKQRVGIARALVTDPKVIFLDEPFSELDSFTAAELRQALLKIWMETHPTIVMVSHLIPEAIELADRIAVLTSRPGRVERVMVNRLPRPRSLRSTAAFQMEDRLYKMIRP